MGWELIMPVALAALLLSAGVEDVRTREIANWKSAAAALLAPLWWWANGLALWPDVAAQLGLATIVFGLFAAAFAAGLMGGGDVKLIGALALWFPLGTLIQFLVVMSVIGGGVAAAMLLQRKFKGGEVEVPYGVAIAAAGLLSLREPILNTFA